ncbi:MAG: riboflavin biosynthesis protein RibF [Thermobacillus sp. ZCTH02-B1]|uniref:bifunctional riboflavin kinase/FAD synthetase n=1 Tax=Thermobacillus sp. ZCTH02-B1 TaxID=1858795 RepID=UPI000B55D63A|nr:bifunctional riboflavin kinase/FAD synthetase [Thermobacillus sp. ZCTH02-B1]OUM96934.1 MAG: riboflavin biosynthesis protein RibF [Thermobacillus sp. ZCTH02-B1]
MITITLRYPPDGAEAPEDRLPKTMAIGTFDGVHPGHQAVIRKAVELARASGRQAAVMTFDPHPRTLLGGEATYAESLTPLPEKIRLLESLGVDIVYVAVFDRMFAAMTPEAFVRELLIGRLHVTDAAVGFDFTFGRGGAGNPASLAELGGAELAVHTVEPVSAAGAKVSSSRIREAVKLGDVALAAALLRRPYRISGTVARGEARGRTLGFPTANIEPDGRYVIPRHGVYAVYVRRGDRIHPAVMNVGVVPTFRPDGGTPRLEAHLLDFSGDLYGERLAVDFVAFIRPELKFGGADALVAQIREDAEQARRLLAAVRG